MGATRASRAGTLRTRFLVLRKPAAAEPPDRGASAPERSPRAHSERDRRDLLANEPEEDRQPREDGLRNYLS